MVMCAECGKNHSVVSVVSNGEMRKICPTHTAWFGNDSEWFRK